MVRFYAKTPGIIAPAPEDELLHAPADPADPTSSETSYFGFNIPERDLNCEIYHWFHPVLGIVSGGLFLFCGEKSYAQQSEYFDYRNYALLPEHGIAKVTYPTGVQVHVVRPLEEIHVTFAAPDGRLEFDFTLSAIMPAAGKEDGGHFTQAMRSSGEVTLNGERMKIDGFFTRDRSWGAPRPEDPYPIPPLTWATAVFDEQLAFHFVAHDNPELEDETVKWGYVHRDGETRSLRAMSKVTRRASDGIAPAAVEIEIEDDAGERYAIEGTVRARAPMTFWPNMLTHMSLFEYRLDGRIGYGDFQDIQYPHFLSQVSPSP